MDRTLANILTCVAAVVSIGAGIYLFQTESASEEATIFDALFKGLGAYMVARGIYMVSRIPTRTPDAGQVNEGGRE